MELDHKDRLLVLDLLDQLIAETDETVERMIEDPSHTDLDTFAEMIGQNNERREHAQRLKDRIVEEELAHG